MLFAPTLHAAPSAQACPLNVLAARAIDATRQGEPVQVVFDLDDTLFLVRPRKQAIFRELAEAHAHDAQLHTALHRLADGAIPYDVKEALATVGIDHPSMVNGLVASFFERFFDGGYTRHDAPNEGAAAYVNHLYAHGVKVVYLSGRPVEMMDYTVETLVAHGFPVCPEQAPVVLKDTHESHLGDAEFKGIKAFEIAEAGRMLAVFDNEPANLNAMLPAMRDGDFFLLDTDHSPNPPAPEMPVVVLKTFERAIARLEASLAATPRFGAGGWTLNVEAGA